ncbi:MAG: type I glyceraldehyde-3-phosphate dehydrogenase [Rickettsiales bacterium]|jgi:glyceraldehyde 3-phosphate dehydrogenase|nr:type I glyceraldehyde-3-phosphate dehydrogenase [Rickettsiales bacterium]|tara:strand:+ start:11056 stop:12057 length:1002 start_codon:yes stop_codon:yes gene_type:complete
MTVKVAINGLGRIGRCVLRAIFENSNYSDIELVAVNASTPYDTLIHLIKYDSVHLQFKHDISYDEDNLVINNKKIKILNNRNPENLPWKELDIDVVFECTGAFASTNKSMLHINAGAKRVLISAPAKDEETKTIIYGVNHNNINDSDKVISVGSCTTNCLAPIAKALNDEIGIEKGFMTTIHAYTNDQNIVDNAHKDLRRARACAMSMIPTSTGAAKAIGKVLPELNSKLDGFAVRVPTPNVSMVDFSFLAARNTSLSEVNSIIKNYSQNSMKNVLRYVEEELVSIDFNHSDHSSSFDSTQTRIIDNNFVKVCSWYDNEWAFSLRMLDIAKIL